MEKELEQFKTEMEAIKLSAIEKELMRVRILGRPRKKTISPFLSYSLIPAYALLIMFMVSLPVVYAAQRSLPGESLYGVKTEVIEKVQEIAAVTPEKKAQFHINTTSKRLSEAAVLIKEGKANRKLLGMVERNIEASSKKALQSSEGIKGKDSIAQKIDLKTDIKNTFQAHSGVFAEIYKDTQDAQAGEFAETLTDSVSAVKKEIDNSISEVGALPPEESNEIIKDYIERMQVVVSDSIKQIEKNELTEEDVKELEKIEDALEKVDDLVAANEQDEAVEVLVDVEEKIELEAKEEEIKKEMEKLSDNKEVAPQKSDVETVEEVNKEVSPDILYR